MNVSGRFSHQYGRAALIIAGALAASALSPSEASEDAADRRTQDALAMDAHPDSGHAPFARYCSSCHGVGAQGDAARLIPGLAGQRFNYLVRQIADFGSAERDNGTMYHVVANQGFAEPQMWVDVASYLSRLAPPVTPRIGNGIGEDRGRSIFRRECATCHGSDASGDDDGFVPSLRNQDHHYLANQLHRVADGHRHNVDQRLVIFMRNFDDKDVGPVADYLSGLHGPAKSHERMLNNGAVVD